MSVGQGGHQAGTMMHLQRTGVGGHGQAPPGLQKAVAHEVAGLLHREGDRLPRLLQAHAGQGQARGWGAIPRLPEDVAMWRRRRWRPPLEGRLGSCTCKEHSLPGERASTLSFPPPQNCRDSPGSRGALWSEPKPCRAAHQPTPTVGLEHAAANGRGAAVRLLEEMVAGVAWRWAGGLDL